MKAVVLLLLFTFTAIISQVSLELKGLNYQNIFTSAQQSLLENDLGKEYVKQFIKKGEEWTYNGPLCRAMRYHCTVPYHLEKLKSVLQKYNLD